MSHHGREYEDDRNQCGEWCERNARRASLADFVLELADAEVERDWLTVRAEAERRLVAAGYPCQAHRMAAKAKALRAAELDAQIERLRAERAKL